MKPTTRFLAASAALAFAGLAAVAASAAVLRVPADRPTIAAALAAASSGDVVLVESGTWDGQLDFAGKDVTLQSVRGPTLTILRSPGGPAIRMGSGAQLLGFTVSGGEGLVAPVTVTGNALLRGNVFENHRGVPGGAAAIAVANAAPVIEGNLFRDSVCDSQAHSGMVQVSGNSPARIVNNVFQRNACTAVSLAVADLAALRVVNNTIVGNRRGLRTVVGGIGMLGGHAYRNNVIARNEIGFEINGPAFADMPMFDHNVVGDNVVDYLGVADQSTLNGNLKASPVFVDPALGNYRLLAGSPGIDAGNPDGAPALDFDGLARPVDGDFDRVARVDMGAYELSARGFVGADLWWNPEEPGWGVSLTQHPGGQVFGVWYTYDEEGRPVWYTLPDTWWVDAQTLSSTIYRARGPAYFGVPFDPARVANTREGSARITFLDPDTARFEYTLGTVTQTKRIQRQRYGTPSEETGFDVGDLWWNEAEPGWGIALNQQFRTLFATWFVYDAQGEPRWLVMPGGRWDGNRYAGAVYTTRGTPAGRGHDPARAGIERVGDATLDFSSAAAAEFRFTVNGVPGTKSITRQPF